MPYFLGGATDYLGSSRDRLLVDAYAAVGGFGRERVGRLTYTFFSNNLVQ